MIRVSFFQILRIKPPMCITKEDADFTVAVLNHALKTHSKHCKKCRPDYTFLGKNK